MRKLGTILTLEILELPRDHINIRSIEQFISSGLSGAGQLKSLNVRGKIAASIEKKLKGTLIQKDIEFIRQVLKYFFVICELFSIFIFFHTRHIYIFHHHTHTKLT